MLVGLNQDMVGARQSMGGRVQYASRLPWSLPHALDDVMDSVLTMVRDGNTSLLTTRGTAHPQPFPREITAVKGSREPFHARMVPYYDSTDHHAFTPAPIGVPATSRILPFGARAGVTSRTRVPFTVKIVSSIELPRSPDRLKNVWTVKLATVFLFTATASYAMTSSLLSVTV